MKVPFATFDVMHKEIRTEMIKKFIKCQLQQWFASLPNYIKVYLPILSCES